MKKEQTEILEQVTEIFESNGMTMNHALYQHMQPLISEEMTLEEHEAALLAELQKVADDSGN